MSMDGFFWYSEQQKVAESQLDMNCRKFCNIGGKVREYTERRDRSFCAWKDAVYLGYGFCSHMEAEDTISNMEKKDYPMVTCWMGKPITEMTKEELIEALEELGRIYREQSNRLEGYMKNLF